MKTVFRLLSVAFLAMTGIVYAYTPAETNDVVRGMLFHVVRLGSHDNFPDNGGKDDGEFQGNCLVFTLFHGQNRISSAHGTNHWIPFTEAEVDAKECFASHFMSDFLAGKGGGFGEAVLPGLEGGMSHAERAEGAEREDGGCANALRTPRSPREIQLTPAARAVLDAGRALWRYYHAQPGANPNASYYDIRKHVKCKIEN